MNTSRLAIPRPRGFRRAQAMLLPAIALLLGHPAHAGFLENRGQVAPEVRYYASGSGMSVFLTDDAIVIDLVERDATRASRPGSTDLRARAAGESPSNQPVEPEAGNLGGRGWAVRIPLLGAGDPASLSASDPLPGTTNFCTGTDPAAWKEGVRSFGEARYREIWPGTDLILRMEADGIAYELISRPGHVPPSVPFGFEGGTSIRELGSGRLVVETPLGEIEHEHDGNSGRISLSRGSDLGHNDPSTLLWSSYFGGSDDDTIRELVILSDGSIVVVGRSRSTDLPTTAGAHDRTANGMDDAFVAGFTSDGSTLIFCTYLGGSQDDRAYTICATGLGTVLVGGGISLGLNGDILLGMTTESPNFPVVNAFDSTLGGISDAAVVSIKADRSGFRFSTYIGGSGSDWCLGLDHLEDRLYICGHTGGGFPVTAGAWDTTQDTFDGFVALFRAATGALLATTYIGATEVSPPGNPGEIAYDFKVSSDGVVAITGFTSATNFPTSANAYDPTHNGGRDIFITRLANDLSGMRNSTFLGSQEDDYPADIALASDDRVFCGVLTYGSGFPVTPDGFDTTFNGVLDGAIAVLYPRLDVLEWSSFLGGTDDDYPFAVAVDTDHNVTIVGDTFSTDFPVTAGAYQTTAFGGYESFLARLSPNLDPAGLEDDDPPPDAARLDVVNPVRDRAVIRYAIPPRTPIDLAVYDVAGRGTKSLPRGGDAQIESEIAWDLTSDAGATVPVDVYFVRMRAGGEEIVRKITVSN